MKVRIASNVAISIIAGAAVLVMVNYLSLRHYHRADWTQSGLFTLSDKTVKVVANLDREVTLHVLVSQGSSGFEDVVEILAGYRSQSPKLKVEMIDPDLNPERVQMVLDRYGAKVHMDESGNVGIEAGIFVVSGDKVKFVSSQSFESIPDPIMGEEQSDQEGTSRFMAEQEITSAIMLVTSDEEQKICFTQGHGEWNFEGYGPTSLGQVKEELKRDSYVVEAIVTAGAGKIPVDCNLVVVAGPGRGFMKEEATLLRKYLNGGGNLILLLDPLIEGERFLATGLEALAADNGIKINDNFVLETDVRRLVSDSPVTFLASEFFNHPSVAQIGTRPVVFSMVRTLDRIPGTDVVADVLSQTSQSSWGEVDLTALGSGETAPAKDEYDESGPLTIAMVASRVTPDGKRNGRLLVVGDSDFLQEELQINTSLFNRDFWAGAVGWMTSRDTLISIAPKNPEHVHLTLTDQDVWMILMFLLGELLLIIAIGVVVAVRRRS